MTAAERGLADADPLVRLAALRTLRPFPVQQSWPLASRLLADPVLGVRIEAASLLASVPQDRLSPDDRNRLSRAIDEYVTAQRVNADRPEHRLNLGNLYLQQGHGRSRSGISPPPARSTPASRRSMSALPSFMRNRAATATASALLREALTRMPDDAELHHALGLNLVRQRRAADALPELARAAAIDPANARYAYVYAVALNSAGRTDEAIKTLEASHARHPADRDTLFALVTINRDAGRNAAALAWADRLVVVDPQSRPLRDEIARLAGVR